MSNNPIENFFQPGAFSTVHFLKVLDVTGNNNIPCECRLTVPLSGMPDTDTEVIGTCINKTNGDGTKESFPISLVRKASRDLMTHTTCDVCLPNPCLHDYTCEYNCTKWEDVRGRQRARVSQTLKGQLAKKIFETQRQS